MMQSIAAFTICRDSPKMLRRWLRHYSRQVSKMYVIDHASSPGNYAKTVELCQPYRAEVISAPNPVVYETRWLTRTATAFQAVLLNCYRRVLFSGVDELVSAGEASLEETDYAAGEAVSWAAGYEIVDRRTTLTDHEFPSYTCQRYTKPVLGRVAINWHSGFDDAANVSNPPVSPNLSLLHLHKFNLFEVVEKHNRLHHEPWDEQGLRYTLTYRHNKIIDPGNLVLWMKSHADNTERFAEFSELPATLAEQLRYACETDEDDNNLRDTVPGTDTGSG
jgi:hypothetical protein